MGNDRKRRSRSKERRSRSRSPDRRERDYRRRSREREDRDRDRARDRAKDVGTSRDRPYADRMKADSGSKSKQEKDSKPFVKGDGGADVKPLGKLKAEGEEE